VAVASAGPYANHLHLEMAGKKVCEMRRVTTETRCFRAAGWVLWTISGLQNTAWAQVKQFPNVSFGGQLVMGVNL